MNERRQRGEDGHRGEQGLEGDRGDRGERGEQGIKGIPGFDGECCSGLVRLMERYKNTESMLSREINDREKRADMNEKKIISETGYREREEEKIWSEISKTNKRVDGMKTMAITVLASSMLSILLFIGTVVAHILKVGP